MAKDGNFGLPIDLLQNLTSAFQNVTNSLQKQLKKEEKAKAKRDRDAKAKSKKGNS